jgi:hypothetical protein
VREALLVAAVLATAGAAWRAWAFGKPALALIGAVATLACVAFAAFGDAEPWLRGAAAVYANALLGKILALGRPTARAMSPPRGLAYLFLHPGLDPDLSGVRDRSADRRRGAVEAARGAVELVGAVAVAGLCARFGILDAGPFPAAWSRAASFVLLLDGFFRLARGVLEASGYSSESVFRDPWKMSDLAEFWSRRWNRFVATTLAVEVYGPVRRRAGRVAAVLATFLVSGVIHEVIFDLPAPGSGGRWTAFFLIQGIAILALSTLPDRSRAARFGQRLAAWAVLLASAPLFFGGSFPRVDPLDDLGRKFLG